VTAEPNKFRVSNTSHHRTTAEMFSKTIFIAAFAAVASIASAASPPACLLGAVNGYSDPADVGAVCKNKDITSKVSQFCGDATADALEALSDICNKAGVKVCK
jgi:hypothetical protein